MIYIYNIKTGSMEDNIHVGDYILILHKEKYKVGDVVTYRKDNYLITHRIIKIDNDDIVTKGDANNIEDEKINKDEIVGKVILNGGILNIIINYKFVIVSIILFIYIISYYIDKDKEVN